jgi:penicillin-binding protein 2
MTRPNRLFDWNSLDLHSLDGNVVSTKLRVRILLVLFLSGCTAVFGRAVQLELTGGEEFRAALREAHIETQEVAAPRGRILARDGTVLAEDREVVGLAVHYRYLQRPLDAKWLTSVARRRLTRAERRKVARVREEEESVRREIDESHTRLAALCGVSQGRWQEQLAVIDRRVARIARKLNARRVEQEVRVAADRSMELPGENALSATEKPIELVSHLFATPRGVDKPIVAREQESYHLVAAEVSAAAAQEVSDHAERYPGAKLVRYRRRCYPRGDSAAQLLGYVSVDESSIEESALEKSTNNSAPFEFATRAAAGIESVADELLKPSIGVTRRVFARNGQELSSRVESLPQAGGDIHLSIDPKLQAWTERLLDRGMQRGEAGHGGAVVIMDVQTGKLLTATSSPRFDPNAFSRNDSSAIADVLSRSDAPLLDRCSQMALPPGSVFKPVVAIALLETGQLNAEARFTCQGYLDDEDAWRCAIFRRQGIGHGDVDLAEALAVSCNVFFFHHATELGAPAILDWARKLGFGSPTGSDLPVEAPGNLPEDDAATDPRSKDNLARSIAIGQHEITATPLQVARMMAALANGGRLVTPTLMHSMEPERNGAPQGTLIPMRRSSIAAVRAGQRMAVSDREGTAHDAAWLPTMAIAGKTGTAQSGGDRPDHAWFAGYVPAENPKFAFCVALEHGGDSTAAASIARQVVQKMIELNLIQVDDERSAPQLDKHSR